MAGGLLDFLNTPEAQLGIGLLAAGGPSTTPMSFGQRVSGAMQGMSAQQDAELKRQLLRSQMEENASQNALRQAQIAKAGQIQALTNGLFAPSAPITGGMVGGGQPGTSGGFSIGINPGAQTQTQVPQADSGSGSGLRGIPLEKVAQLKAMGGPDLLEAWKLANVPTSLSAGSYSQLPGQAPKYLADPTKGVDFRNGAVSRLPGSEALAGLEGEKAGAIAWAKNPADIAADRSRQILQAQLDPVQAVNQQTGDTDFVPRASLVGAQPGGIALGGASPFGTGGQSQSQNPYIAARNPIKQQSQIALNDNWIKSTYQPVKDAGNTATDLQNSIQAMRNIDFNSGWGAESKANAAAFLEGLGVNVGSSKLYAANAQKFQSIAMDRLLTTLGAQKGPQTEGDAQRAQQTFAKLNNTPEANQFVLDFAQAKANMDQAKASFYDSALPVVQQKGDLTAADRAWRKVGYSVWNDPILQKWAK